MVQGRFISVNDVSSFNLPANYQDFLLSGSQRYAQVATNSRGPSSKAGSNKSIFSRSHHIARGEITEIAIRIPNWYSDRASTKLEFPNEGTAIWGASVEYPSGTYTRLRFSGKIRGGVMPGGDLISDFLAINIPDGTEFWIRTWCLTTGTIIFQTQDLGQNSTNGEQGTVATTAVTDSTASSTAVGAISTGGLWPLAIIGRTTQKAVALVGDSISEGVSDTLNSSDAIGLARSVVSLPYINLGVSGDSAAVAVTTFDGRLSALSHVNNVVCNYGVNDIGNGQTLAQIKTNLINLWGLINDNLPNNGRVFQTTITPKTTSTDSFATLGNQTAATNFSTGGAGTRELLNDWLRDGAPISNGVAAAIGAVDAFRVSEIGHPLYGVFEVADVVESSRNSGKWKVDGTSNKWTSDGVHGVQYSYLQIATSGAISISEFA